MKSKIIIDNDCLVNLTGLERFNVFSLLRNVFSQILIPVEVKNEYEKYLEKEPKRIFILDRLRPNEGFWSLCSISDSYSTDLLLKHNGIDKGEAEVISQSEKTGVNVIISDDTKFKTAYNKLNKNARIYSSLFLLALLDIHNYLNSPVDIFKELYKIRPFKHSDLKEAYNQASAELQISFEPVKISRKTYKNITEPRFRKI